jgi:ankyrin repeat protein
VYGRQVDAVNEEGMTALHTAAAYSQSDAVRALLEVGAAVNAADHEGFTPLDWAVANRHTAVKELLVQAGACTSDALAPPPEQDELLSTPRTSPGGGTACTSTSWLSCLGWTATASQQRG